MQKRNASGWSVVAYLWCLSMCTTAWSQSPGTALSPVNLSLQPEPEEPESVYAPPAPPRPDEGVNQGAVSFDLSVGYFTDYIYRGIEPFEPPASEDSANFQIDARLSWDLGKFPHPFIAVFANLAESDPVSTFQEIRPTVGFEWTLRPFIVSAGYTNYTYPDRDDQDTSEVWGNIELDDSYFFRTDRPIFSPYILFAYDVDLYNGWYFEGGVSHDFPLEEIGVVLTFQASIAYVYNFDLYATTPGGEDSGFQHYQLGLIGTYSLNELFNISQRYGQWSIIGSLYYTGGIENDLRAEDQLWGGVSIGFSY